MVICLKVKTLDSQTYDFTVDDEISVKQFKETIAEKTNISADLQRIIYCGRVLSDEKLLKEYDVNGKVVHVVERPPPSSRLSSNLNDNSNRRTRDGLEGNVRGSPIFRALDGMVVGAMTIPVNASGTSQPTVPPLNPSSSFCMNRITVARHMLECANNIASYLENPERGLNNSSLDILAQGRWTMESTVVEVGISAADNVEISQNHTQNIVEALHGAVSAALRQNGHPNVTVVQLPTVFGSNGTAVVSSQSVSQTTASSDDQTPVITTTAGSGQSEPIIDDNMANATGTRTETQAEVDDANAINANETAENDSSQERRPNASSVGNSTTNSPTRQRTGTRVLADVIHQMNAVQNRLTPFINQYYDILLNDPLFEENDTAGREAAQRLFDRVSEALHYMSHAQHAISDLMLDLSQPTPRYLCCRPILVEQSGFVSANNFASLFQPNGNGNGSASNGGNPTATISISNEAPSSIPIFIRPPPPYPQQSQQQQTSQQSQPQPQQVSAPSTVNSTTNQSSETNNTTSSAGTQQNQTQQNVNRSLHQIFSPLLLPMSPRFSPSSAANNVPANNTTTNNDNVQSDADNQGQIRASPQLQVARFIQAVVNSAPMDADLHVQINAPNLLSFGAPEQQQQQQSQVQTTQSSTQHTSVANISSAASVNTTTNQSNQARVTTATHPTTSTQTRSTARPQVHLANIPPSQMWNTRIIPANMVSSFDRFLPCSSHHIRENESSENTQNASMNFPRSRTQFRQRRQQQHQQQQQQSQLHQQRTTAVPSTPRNTSTTTQEVPSNRINNNISNDFFLSNEIPINLFGNNITLRELIDFTPSPSTFNRIRNHLLEFIVNNLFAGAPITEQNMNNAINNVIQLLNDALLFLPQFDVSDYDSRASVENFIRNSLPFIINLIHEDDSNEFGTRLVRELMSFIRRLFVIIVTCVGRANAELYLNQISQMALNLSNVPEQEALRGLQRYLMSAIIRELDITLQNTSDVQEFLVIRRPNVERQQNDITPMETDDQNTSERIEQQHTQERAIDVPESMIDRHQQLSVPKSTTTASSSSPSRDQLPKVIVGSEPWHNHFPTNWLPIITRDIERQRRQNSQNSFSDAYISGMSAKRRKLIANSKPPTDMQSLITDGVRRAIQNVGIPSSNSSTTTTSSSVPGSSTSLEYTMEEVSTAIGTDPNMQLSYREALRSNLEDRLRTDTDFVPDKFPNSSKYFTK